MTPDTLAKSNSEHGQQRALFAWANMAARFGFEAAWDDRSYTVTGHAQQLSRATDSVTPACLHRLFAVPNGGQRDKITAGKLKAEGVKRGVPDIMLPLPMRMLLPGAIRFCGLFIEMKRPKAAGQVAGSTSEDQDGWIGYLRSVGYAVSVCFDWRAAAKELQSYIEASNAQR
jgi:hypothetical protein